MSAVLAPRRVDAAFEIDRAFLDDPYPTYARLRQRGPVLWSEAFGDGAWLVTHHADAERVLADPRFSARRTGAWVNQAGEAMRGVQPLFARALLFLDDPDHKRLRPLMQQAFTPSALQGLRETIRELTRALLARAEATGGTGLDVIAQLARPLPAQVMARLLGLPESMDEPFAAWSDDLAAFIGHPRPQAEQARRAQTSLLAMARSFDPVIAQRQRAPGDDLVGRLVQAQSQGQVHGTAELLAQCAMLLFAGHETTRNLLGNAVWCLLRDGDRWQRLAGEVAAGKAPELGAIVREVLRHECPVQYTGRRLSCDLELHGQRMRRGDAVIVLIGSANRDPARHPQPDRFDPSRQGSSLAFGRGPHVCLGAALSLMEGQIVLDEMLARWPGLSLVPDAPGSGPAAAAWLGSPLYRGLRHLQVVPGRCAA